MKTKLLIIVLLMAYLPVGAQKAKIGSNLKYGYTNSNDSWLITPQYDEAWDFSEGYGLVRINDKYGFVNSDGTWHIDLIFDDASIYSNELAAAKVGKKWGY